MSGWIDAGVAFVEGQPQYALLVVFGLAFVESIAVVSAIVPAWLMLVGIGALIGTHALTVWPILLGGALGAMAGSWLSYWVGVKLQHRARQVWPLSRYPAVAARAERFLDRWGTAAIFVGRYSGPLRAWVPLAAGIFHMPYWRFQLANVASAFLWISVLLAFGNVVATTFEAVLNVFR